jgi:hypothetical protein
MVSPPHLEVTHPHAASDDERRIERDRKIIRRHMVIDGFSITMHGTQEEIDLRLELINARP